MFPFRLFHIAHGITKYSHPPNQKFVILLNSYRPITIAEHRMYVII